MQIDDLHELMSRDEELRDDLQPFVRSGPIGQMLHHPLLIEIMLIPGKNALVNRRYEHFVERLERAAAAGDWNRWVGYHERAYRLDALHRAAFEHGFVNDPGYWPAVGWVWSDSENIWEEQDRWHDVWAAPGDRLAAMSEDDRAVYDALPDRVWVYRGVDDNGRVGGMSWSLDREKAQWFAERWYAKRPRVYEAEVRKSDILAVFVGRGESEVVVMPDRLKKLKRVKLGPRPAKKGS